ncbi:MAG TPA: pyridine nucleotide-disulfide oxidoreductase [Candidatus Atribacteria bacterium]|nr:pyridine nucleotide-disulfide oxidoreductase [Candidatus Atribacteria bacterium]
MNSYQLAIIGGGPAAVSAGVYAGRKKIKTILITESFGGQSIVSEEIQNWIGTPSISGQQLAKDLEKHLRVYQGENLEIITGDCVKNIQKSQEEFTIETTKEKTITAQTVLLATGSKRRKLKVPGADIFEHKGLTYCATCDAPLFSGLDVAVIGGGNAALETATQLSAHCQKVYLLHRRNEFRADEITVEKIKANPKITILTPVTPLEVLGDKMVTGLKYLNTETNQEKELAVQGIFVEIGHLPNTPCVQDLVDLDEGKAIIVDPKNQRTSQAGIWAAGDCTDGLFKQNNIAVGDAIKALEDIYCYLHLR